MKKQYWIALGILSIILFTGLYLAKDKILNLVSDSGIKKPQEAQDALDALKIPSLPQPEQTSELQPTNQAIPIQETTILELKNYP